jgi:hypothetical protein
VPFTLNASVGDTVKFIWGANNHTVTKSSELALCNKTSDQPFASGEQNKTFVCKNNIHLPVFWQRLTNRSPLVTQVVNDTNPTFFYCGTPTHCEKGMFGIINAPNAYMSNTSVGMMMPSLAGQYPSTQAAMSYTSNVTANSSTAASWGMNMDMSGMPSWSQQYAAENVLFTRAVLGMNPETLSADGSVDFSNIGSTPLMVPTDVAASMSSNNADNSTGSYGYGSSGTSSTSSSASPSSSAVGGSSKSSSSGAGALSSPRVAVALVAVAAAFFAL